MDWDWGVWVGIVHWGYGLELGVGIGIEDWDWSGDWGLEKEVLGDGRKGDDVGEEVRGNDPVDEKISSWDKGVREIRSDPVGRPLRNQLWTSEETHGLGINPDWKVRVVEGRSG